MNLLKKFLPIAALATFLTGCSSFVVLQDIVNYSDEALSVLETLDPALPYVGLIATYLNDVNTCLAAAPATPTAGEIVTITTCLAQAIAPTLPPGLPQALVAIVTMVIKDVANWIESHGPATLAKYTKPGAKLSTAQQTTVVAINSKALSNATRCKVLISKSTKKGK